MIIDNFKIANGEDFEHSQHKEIITKVIDTCFSDIITIHCMHVLKHLTIPDKLVQLLCVNVNIGIFKIKTKNVREHCETWKASKINLY